MSSEFNIRIQPNTCSLVRILRCLQFLPLHLGAASDLRLIDSVQICRQVIAPKRVEENPMSNGLCSVVDISGWSVIRFSEPHGSSRAEQSAKTVKNW